MVLLENGGDGATALAEAAVAAADEPNSFDFTYALDAPIEEKIRLIATRVYGADGAELLPAAKHNSYGPPKERLPRIPHEDHEMNWINTIKGKDKLSSDFEYGAHLTEIMLLGIASLRARSRLHYDAVNMRVTNSEAANQFLTREYRKGYSL